MTVTVRVGKSDGFILREEVGNLGPMKIARTLSNSHLLFYHEGKCFMVSVGDISEEVMKRILTEGRQS